MRQIWIGFQNDLSVPCSIQVASFLARVSASLVVSTNGPAGCVGAGWMH